MSDHFPPKKLVSEEGRRGGSHEGTEPIRILPLSVDSLEACQSSVSRERSLAETVTTRTFFLLLIMSATLSPAAEVARIHKLTPAEATARLERDAREVLLHRDGLRDVIGYVETRADLFPVERPNPSRLLRREQKEDVWNTWQRFLDYMMALDSIEKYHADFYRLKGVAREDSFLIGYAAMQK
jgi:hypothetical protein